jgi:hypothetical protein
MNYQTTQEIEIAIVKYYGYRNNIIIPNISWGLDVHECDLFILNENNYATEIEIKVSVSDLKKDCKKKHKHISDKIKYFWFAIPSKLCKYIEYIPIRAGILIVNSKGRVFVLDKPKTRKNSKKLSEDERLQLLRLGVMRLWPLKEKLLHLKEKIK